MLSTLWILFYVFCAVAGLAVAVNIGALFLGNNEQRAGAVGNLFVEAPLNAMRLYFFYGILTLLGGGA